MRASLRTGFAFALCCAATISITGSASGFGYEDALADGTSMPGVSTMNLALGGIRAVGFGEPASVLLNPAYLTRVSSPAITIAVGPAVAQEMIDLGYSRNTRDFLALGQASFAARIPVSRTITLGAGICRLTDMTYSKTVYLLEDQFHPEQITSIESFESSGGLWESAVGFGYRPARWLTVGFSAGPRFGTGSAEFERQDIQGSDDSTWVSDWEENSLACRAGVSVPFGLNSIGLSWVSESDHYPSRIAGGVVFYSGTAHPGAFGFEGEIAAPGDENRFTGRLFGVISPDRPLEARGSMFFTDRGSNQGSTSLGFSFGVGLTFGRFNLDGTFSWQRKTRKELAFGYGDVEDVIDNLGVFLVGAGYRF
jgi:hypothetical protein